MKVTLTTMDFSSIKESLKEFMKTQDHFKDYNFDGSGLNALLDVLAFNSQNNAYLANMLANEAEIDSAILRSNVVSRAKLLGYTPKSTTASRAVLTITVTDNTKTQDSLVLPRGTRFAVKGEGRQFVFLTLQEHTLKKVSNGVYRGSDIEVFEGVMKAFTFDVTSKDRRYVIPTRFIDTSTIRLAVYENETTTEYEVYEKESSITSLDEESKAYWVYETDNGFYEVKFGDGVFGKPPALNSIVFIEYLESAGDIANGLSRFSLVGSFAGFEDADIRIETQDPSDGGTMPESTESIKLNAPRFFQSQNRAVTKEDFAAVAREIYPYAKSVAVWGGEGATPPQFGKVFISIVPKNQLMLTSANKRSLERKIAQRSIVGIQPRVIDPNFIDIGLSIRANVKRGSNNSLGSLNNQIRETVKGYFEDEFGVFDSDFYYSNILTLIKTSNRSISNVSADLTLTVSQRVGTTGVRLSFENAIDKTMPITSSVTGMEVQGDVVMLNNAAIGTIDYASGTIQLDNHPSLPSTVSFTVTPSEEDIMTGFASALRLKEDALNVEIGVLP